MILILTAVPVGGAVFVLGFVFGDSPCVMCWEQRTGMAIIALIGLFVLRYGPRPKYIGLAVLVGAWGMFMSLRHTAMHAARDIGQGFSLEFMGAHTYTWALFIFWICIVTMGFLLTALKEAGPEVSPRALGTSEKLAIIVFLVVIAGNGIQAFASTGPPPFMGQGDPVRFSFNPAHWVWSMEEWSAAPISLRGRWSVAKPGAIPRSTDPAAGPLLDLPRLTIKERIQLSFPLQGTPTDLAYDAIGDRFLITTQNGIYILDGAFSRILRSTVVDPGYSVDLGQFAGAAFLDSQTVMAIGENKSYVLLRESDQPDVKKNFRYFLAGFDQFEELSRSRLSTVRARMMYVQSLAFDPASRSLYTITVPNAKTQKLTVSRFDRADLTLSEEFLLKLAADSGLKLAGNKRSLDEYIITGCTFADGLLYAISAAYNTLLIIDPSAHAITAAYAIPGLADPTGIAIKGSKLYIASAIALTGYAIPELSTLLRKPGNLEFGN
jgi:disulfide bond formation protein DsbB